VTVEEGKAIAEQYKIKYYEVSAKQNINLSEAFQQIMTQVYNKLYNDSNSQTSAVQGGQHLEPVKPVAAPKKTGGCCSS